MKVKVQDASGIVLDWLVAKCKGVNLEAFALFYEPTELGDFDGHGFPEFHYSTVWSQGGPIIERIATKVEDYGDEIGVEGVNAPEMFGPTILVAAMRCYVASQMGEEVEIPEELA